MTTPSPNTHHLLWQSLPTRANADDWDIRYARELDSGLAQKFAARRRATGQRGVVKCGWPGTIVKEYLWPRIVHTLNLPAAPTQLVDIPAVLLLREFGGTPPVAERARAIGFFERVFDGSQPPEEVSAYLRGAPCTATETDYPQTAVARIAWKAPYPLIRHHFGLPTMAETLNGIAAIAEARVLDVISLGIDQDAQENFFRPERQDPRRTGAGGVPVRSADDYRALYAASRRGNFPLLRTYSGTDDFIRLAEMYVETINIAWAAVPLFWFNAMDGRGPWDLENSIRQHQELMHWYGGRGISVELNEPYHWGMRDAPDVVYVATAYLSAYNARTFGVRDYIAQMMFNSPPGLSDAMDLAKMLACLEIIQPLAGDDFRIWRQTRVGLLSHPLDLEAARGHLAAATYLQMALKPHIVHVVGHTEAHHAATAEDVIAACKVARRAIEDAVAGAPDMTTDPRVQARKRELIAEAQITLGAIRALAGRHAADPLADPATLARAVTSGILDAPHLRNNPYGRGQVVTRIDERGACVAVNAAGRPLSETQRIFLTKASLRLRSGQALSGAADL
jgi:hypothetical protein